MQSKSEKKQLDLIYGIHPIQEVLKARKRKISVLYTTKPTPRAWPSIEPLLSKGTQIQYVTTAILDKIANSQEHQGFVAYVTPFIVRKQFFDAKKQPFLLLLDGIQDVRNVGAIIRSAVCTNVDGIILVKKGGAPLTAAAIKSSAGLAEHIDIFVAPSATHALQLLKKAGYTPYLAVVQGGQEVTKTEYQMPLCLVIGSEATGISPEIRSQGVRISLAQKSPDISYNASVAAGILLFTIASTIKKI